MKKSRFSESQIISILKQIEAGTPVPQLCREHGMGSALFYRGRSKYCDMDALMMARRKKQKEGNQRLKRCTSKSGSRLRWWPRHWQRSDSAISSSGDGAKSRQR
jgi:putative transposase